MDLEGLISLLNNEAGLSLTKSASDDESEDDKNSKDSKEDKEDKSDKSKGSDSKDKEDKDSDDEDSGSVKEAQLAGAALYNEIMQKVASANSTPATTTNSNKDTEMNKQASQAGSALAASLLQKIANVGDQTTVDGINPTAVPNKIQLDVANVVREDDSKVKPLPGTGGSLNQIFDSIVQDALSQGTTSTDQVHERGQANREGVAEAAGTPNQVDVASAEKTAALVALTNSGIDFDSAIDMIKAAQEEIDAEYSQNVKQAAEAELVAKGIDPVLAAALVKVAGVQAPAVDVMAEKRAAFDMLVDQGVSFSDAAALVDAKASQLYGA